MGRPDKMRTSNIQRRTSNVEQERRKQQTEGVFFLSLIFFGSTLGVRCSMFDVRVFLRFGEALDVRCSHFLRPTLPPWASRPIQVNIPPVANPPLRNRGWLAMVGRVQLTSISLDDKERNELLLEHTMAMGTEKKSVLSFPRRLAQTKGRSC